MTIFAIKMGQQNSLASIWTQRMKITKQIAFSNKRESQCSIIYLKDQRKDKEKIKFVEIVCMNDWNLEVFCYWQLNLI